MTYVSRLPVGQTEEDRAVALGLGLRECPVCGQIALALGQESCAPCERLALGQ